MGAHAVPRLRAWGKPAPDRALPPDECVYAGVSAAPGTRVVDVQTRRVKSLRETDTDVPSLAEVVRASLATAHPGPSIASQHAD